MKVLVTGGSGFVGKRLKLIRPDWIYVSSKDFNLLKFDECMKMLEQHKPDAVVHLAAIVGGIKDNLENPATFFYNNVSMNTNIVHACYLSGIKRLLASLSTCIFPDKLKKYPFSENDIFCGPPAESNFSYGYAKRCLLVQINTYRKQYELNYSTFSPSNIYGPEDNFENDKSHFVPAAIRKIMNAKDEVTFWGTGKSLRQQLFVDDLCSAIPLILENHNDSDPLIVAPDENLSIKDMVETICSVTNQNLKIKFDGSMVGQHRKDGSNTKFKILFPDFKFTSFYDGIKETIKWYEESNNNRN
jgi:GDP-L-fucose synthase